MRCNYVEYSFDDRAKGYFSKALDYGHALDKNLLSLQDIDDGKITAFLPKDSSQDAIYRFSGGGVASRVKSIECIVGVIGDFLAISENRICLLEDALSRPDDQFETEQNVSILTLLNEVYFFIRNGVDAEKINYAITEAEQPNFFVSILSSTPSKDFLPSNAESITSNHIEILAERTEKIILGAYDGEGYLIWSKR